MYRDKKVIVVMPAYNAAKTLKATYDEVVDQGIVDEIILVDDGSKDETVALARGLANVTVHIHDKNRGYGGNQKSCYRLALEKGGDIVIMVHPDYQYTPKLIPALASIIANGLHEFVIGSRILGGYALKGGMPWWKYTANRFLTGVQNLLLGGEAFRISYRLPGVFPSFAGNDGLFENVRRFSLRQSVHRPGRLERLHNWGSQLPDQILCRGLLH